MSSCSHSSASKKSFVVASPRPSYLWTKRWISSRWRTIWSTKGRAVFHCASGWCLASSAFRRLISFVRASSCSSFSSNRARSLSTPAWTRSTWSYREPSPSGPAPVDESRVAPGVGDASTGGPSGFSFPGATSGAASRVGLDGLALPPEDSGGIASSVIVSYSETPARPQLGTPANATGSASGRSKGSVIRATGSQGERGCGSLAGSVVAMSTAVPVPSGPRSEDRAASPGEPRR